MSDLSNQLIPYKQRAQRHKKAAIQARKDGDLPLAKKKFQEARDAIDEAVEEIESYGEFNPEMSGPIDQASKDQAFELADCWGIRGGIYREEGEIQQAIEAYGKGYELERNPQYEIQSTYNTVQRLVVRLLSNPALLKENGTSIPDSSLEKPLRELLAEAAEAIEKKWQSMDDPVWALADMVLIRTLLQMPGVGEWEKIFKSKAKDRFPFDSLGAVVKRLAQEDLPPIARSLNELAVRLDQAAIEKEKDTSS